MGPLAARVDHCGRDGKRCITTVSDSKVRPAKGKVVRTDRIGPAAIVEGATESPSETLDGSTDSRTPSSESR